MLQISVPENETIYTNKTMVVSHLIVHLRSDVHDFLLFFQVFMPAVNKEKTRKRQMMKPGRYFIKIIFFSGRFSE